MDIHLPENLENSILEVVQGGQFPSVDDAMAEAARLLLQQIKQHRPRPSGNAAPGQPARAEDEPSSQELQRRLFDAGVLSEIKPPITDLTPYRNRQAVPIQGEPLSETVIRERR
jgi:Arc/MetJ-type ribon-helix-helix transcriptional regulator